MASSFPGSTDAFTFVPAPKKAPPYDQYQLLQDAIVAIENWGRGLSPGGWTSYTPVFTNLSLGNGTLSGSYETNHKYTVAEIVLVWGSTTSISGSVTFTLPANNTGASGVIPLGQAVYFDSSAVASYKGHVLFSAAGSGLLLTNASPMALLSSTVPFTWATSDQIVITLGYKNP